MAALSKDEDVVDGPAIPEGVYFTSTVILRECVSWCHQLSC